jgi:hypothetical protein
MSGGGFLSGVGRDAMVAIYRDVFGPEFTGWIGPPAPTHVHMVFYTYSGFLNFAIQRKHDLWLSDEQARSLLWRLHAYNLKWGWFALGGPLIPLLSCFNYWQQLRSLRRQQEQNLWDAVSMPAAATSSLPAEFRNAWPAPTPPFRPSAQQPPIVAATVSPAHVAQSVGAFAEQPHGTQRAASSIVGSFAAILAATGLLALGTILIVVILFISQCRHAANQLGKAPPVPPVPFGIGPHQAVPPRPPVPGIPQFPEPIRAMVEQQQRDIEQMRAEQTQMSNWPQVAGTAVTADTPLQPDTILQAQFGARWYPVRVLDVLPDQNVRVRWIGWGNAWIEVLPRERLQIPSSEAR